MQHDSYESYTLHVGGVEFDENSDLADIITQGDYYAVYYLDAGKEILSMERLPNMQKIWKDYLEWSHLCSNQPLYA